MPKFVFVETLKPRQRKQRVHEVQALNREAALKELTKAGVADFESIEDLPAELVDPITLETGQELGVGITGASTHVEAVVSVLLRISDLGKVAELVIGTNSDGEPYRSYFKAMSVEESPKGVRVKGMALVAPPDPLVYDSRQGDGMRKWLAEDLYQIRVAPDGVTVPSPEEFGRLSFTVR